MNKVLYYTGNLNKRPERTKSVTAPISNMMMDRPRANNFVKHRFKLHQFIFNAFSVNTTEDKLGGTIKKKKLRMTGCREKPPN